MRSKTMRRAPTTSDNTHTDEKLPDTRQLIEDMRRAVERVDALVQRRTLAAIRAKLGK
jgi:hypothetical protein